jgi:hypothetical protein
MDVTDLTGGIDSSLSLLAMLAKAFRWARGKPSADEDKRVKTLVKFIDERRVFTAPYHMEAVDACIGSLGDVKNATERTLANLEHDGLRAAVGGILDMLRAFLDRWPNGDAVRCPRPKGPSPCADGPQATEAEFFKDLGTVRTTIVILLELIASHTKVVTTNIRVGAKKKAGKKKAGKKKAAKKASKKKAAK